MQRWPAPQDSGCAGSLASRPDSKLKTWITMGSEARPRTGAGPLRRCPPPTPPRGELFFMAMATVAKLSEPSESSEPSE